ncbi:MAG: hypothetical protein DWH91_17335 [Planctomycetota bacterium]|nr:MAG: hypothetical protein DWH91_17335 [Planctomycetota bacterium]
MAQEHGSKANDEWLRTEPVTVASFVKPKAISSSPPKGAAAGAPELMVTDRRGGFCLTRNS